MQALFSKTNTGKCCILGSKGVKCSEMSGYCLRERERETEPPRQTDHAMCQRQTCRMNSGRLFSSVMVEYFPQLCYNSCSVDLVLFCEGIERQPGGGKKKCKTGRGNKAEPF